MGRDGHDTQLVRPSRHPTDSSIGDAASHARAARPSPVPVFPPTAEALRRQVADCGPAREPLAVLDVVGNGGGQPLTPELRTEMEGRLGADFSHVRVHTDAKAAESAASVSARAYTVGNEIVFGRDSFGPNNREGKHRLAHELIHVQQQWLGPVACADARSGIAVSDPSDHFEREAKAKASQVMSDSPPTTASGVRSSGREASDPLSHWTRPAGRATVQRDQDIGDQDIGLPEFSARQPEHTPEWQAYFQAALQGAHGDPSHRAKDAKAIANVAEMHTRWRSKILARLVDTLPDRQDQLDLQTAFAGTKSFWATSFNTALQVTSGESGSALARVESAAKIADQAVLVIGSVSKDLWRKYMDALKKESVAPAKSAPAKSAPAKSAPAKSAPQPSHAPADR